MPKAMSTNPPTISILIFSLPKSIPSRYPPKEKIAVIEPMVITDGISHSGYGTKSNPEQYKCNPRGISTHKTDKEVSCEITDNRHAHMKEAEDSRH